MRICSNEILEWAAAAIAQCLWRLGLADDGEDRQPTPLWILPNEVAYFGPCPERLFRNEPVLQHLFELCTKVGLDSRGTSEL